MGLFSRRSQADRSLARDGTTVVVATAVWQPDGAEPAIAYGWDMDDDGCAGEEAYGVTFISSSVPGCTITVWTYACWAATGAPHDFEMGHRYEYRAGDAWAASLYSAVTPGEFGGRDAADEAAQLTAMTLAVSPRDGGPDDHGAYLDWDGASW